MAALPFATDDFKRVLHKYMQDYLIASTIFSRPAERPTTSIDEITRINKVTVIAVEFNHWTNDGFAGINYELLEKMAAKRKDSGQTFQQKNVSAILRSTICLADFLASFIYRLTSNCRRRNKNELIHDPLLCTTNLHSDPGAGSCYEA